MPVSSEDSGCILIVKEQGIVSVTLNSPEVRNRISTENILFLRKMLKDIELDTSVRALIFTGVGDCFCSGFDLKEISSITTNLQNDAQAYSGQDTEHLSFEELTSEIERLRCPTICAINGHTYGGGVDLALACDYRIGVVGSKIQIPAAKIGLHYPLSSIQRLVSNVGKIMSKRLLLAAEKLSGDELLACGFIQERVESGDLQERAYEVANNYCSLAPLAIEAMKSAIYHFSQPPVIEEELIQRYQNCAQSEDFYIGIQAMMSKTPAKFIRR